MAMPISVTYPSSATGAQTPLSLDWHMVPTNVAWLLIVPGGTTFNGTIDHTFDDLNAPGAVSIANANWQSSLAITATTEGTFSIPVPFMRLTVTSISGGSVTLKVIQGFSEL